MPLLIFPKKGGAFTRLCAGRILFIITTVIIYTFIYIFKYIIMYKYMYIFIFKYKYKYIFIYKYIYIVQTPAKSNIQDFAPRLCFSVLACVRLCFVVCYCLQVGAIVCYCVQVSTIVYKSVQLCAFAYNCIQLCKSLYNNNLHSILRQFDARVTWRVFCFFPWFSPFSALLRVRMFSCLCKIFLHFLHLQNLHLHFTAMQNCAKSAIA